MSYKSRTNLTAVTPIDADTMSLIYEAMWRVNTANGMSANGYTRLRNGAVVFTSSNPVDVSQVLVNKCWDTKRLFKGVEEGDTVYVLPSRSIFESGKCVMGVKGIATTEMFRLSADSEPKQWLVDSEETADGNIVMVSNTFENKVTS